MLPCVARFDTAHIKSTAATAPPAPERPRTLFYESYRLMGVFGFER